MPKLLSVAPRLKAQGEPRAAQHGMAHQIRFSPKVKASFMGLRQVRGRKEIAEGVNLSVVRHRSLGSEYSEDSG